MGKISLTYYGLVALGQSVLDADFEESDHPRDKDGQFAKGAGGSKESKSAADEKTKTYGGVHRGNVEAKVI